MDKFFLKLADPEQYTDNRFGKIIRDMTEHLANDAVILFRDHVVVLEWLKEENEYEMNFYKMYKDSSEKSYIDVYEETRITKRHSCHKWVPYILMKTFREIYPELKECNFPVEEYNIWFTDAYSWVFSDVENTEE